MNKNCRPIKKRKQKENIIWKKKPVQLKFILKEEN